MEQKFYLGNFIVEPGERAEGSLSLADGKFQLPAVIIRGKKPGKTVLITGGIHAGEYVGIQAAIELAEGLKAEEIAGTVILIKVVNVPAFENRTGSLGFTDGKNLNRVFPGRAKGTEMEQLAWALTQEVFPKADYYIDLHSGDDYEQLTPYVYYAGAAADTVVEMSRNMAKQTDVPYMVRSAVAAGGAYNYAASIGIPGILLERGGMGGWSLEEVTATRRDVLNVLRYLGVCQEPGEYRKYYPLEVRDVTYQAASFQGCWYPLKAVGELIKEGEVLGYVRDYEGNILETSLAQYDGVLLFQTGSLQVVEDGPMIAYGRIVKDADDRKERIVRYWTKRSSSFMEQRRAELESPLAQRWLTEILSRIPSERKLKILDVGCGTGFFSILLAQQGHEATGIDLTPDMITCAERLAEEKKAECRFLVMDGENISFPDESFDVVISRNLTWTLPDAGHAYRQWLRVLRKGGVLLNFDANYGINDCTDTKELPVNHAHNTIETELLLECEEIKRQLPISTYARPAWDIEALGQAGAEKIEIDLGVSSRIYLEKDEFYNPAPLFLLRVEKA